MGDQYSKTKRNQKELKKTPDTKLQNEIEKKTIYLAMSALNICVNTVSYQRFLKMEEDKMKLL